MDLPLRSSGGAGRGGGAGGGGFAPFPRDPEDPTPAGAGAAAAAPDDGGVDDGVAPTTGDPEDTTPDDGGFPEPFILIGPRPSPSLEEEPSNSFSYIVMGPDVPVSTYSCISPG